MPAALRSGVATGCSLLHLRLLAQCSGLIILLLMFCEGAVLTGAAPSSFRTSSRPQVITVS
jgi:hypothetical protein